MELNILKRMKYNEDKEILFIYTIDKPIQNIMIL